MERILLFSTSLKILLFVIIVFTIYNVLFLAIFRNKTNNMLWLVTNQVKIILFYNIPIAVIWGPFLEELVFRFSLLILFDSVAAPYAWVCILVSAIFFGLIHTRGRIPRSEKITQFVFTGFIGMLFGYITIKCQSIWPAVILHAGWNLRVCLMGLFEVIKFRRNFWWYN